MLWRTHVLAGMSTGLLIAGHGADLKTLIISAGVAGVGALLPDIDSPYSKIGRKVPILPKLLTITVGHRGLLHSLPGAIIVSLLLAAVAKIFLPGTFTGLLALVMAGYLSHLFMDLFTSRGCPLLWPLPIRFRLPIIHTGSPAERLVVFPATGMFFIWLAWPTIYRIVNKVFAWRV